MNAIERVARYAKLARKANDEHAYNLVMELIIDAVRLAVNDVKAVIMSYYEYAEYIEKLSRYMTEMAILHNIAKLKAHAKVIEDSRKEGE